ncbi:MAG: hypothetical protein IKS16_03245, partial [Lachnospiraceae bacterium]|nr:hypothetical protein [Lachnospiraceae bacterium]
IFTGFYVYSSVLPVIFTGSVTRIFCGERIFTGFYVYSSVLPVILAGSVTRIFCGERIFTGFYVFSSVLPVILAVAVGQRFLGMYIPGYTPDLRSSNSSATSIPRICEVALPR